MKKNTIALTAVLVTGALILVALFGRVIVHPDSYLFSASGDAVKSYFNFGYYLKYGSGIDHTGINYPYGEHLQYMNSHPLYLQIMKFVDRHIYPVSEHGVGILNLTMILSLLAAIPFIFLVLRKFYMPRWYAAVVSLIILFLSPQVDRLGGHFEMVYAFFIPLYWYLLIRWHEASRKAAWTVLLLMTALAGGFTSAYYAAFLSVFPLAVLLVQLWNHRKKMKGYIPEGLYLLLISLIPLLIVKGTASLTDWVDDRPDNPWGFFIFHANVFSIFLPSHSLLQQVSGDFLPIRYTWEGRAYVGFPATLLAVFFTGTMLLQLAVRKKIRRDSFFPNKSLNLYLAASLLVLLFSMCIPFKWGLGFLTEVIPPLKQFRCLGRFAWIFYYVFTVFTATYLYTLYRVFRRKGYGAQALTMLLAALFFWGLESASRIQGSTRHLFNRNELFQAGGPDLMEILKESGTSADEFQGIFFLPFANTCGDKLRFERGLDAFTQAMRCSYQTGIPIVQSFSPRISFSQAMSSIQLLADSCIYKQRVDDMNQKPLLLVVGTQELSLRESGLLHRAGALWSGERFSLARLPVQAFNQGFEPWMNLASSLADSLDGTGIYCSAGNPEQLIYRDFEIFSADRAFTGSGSFFLKRGSMELFNEKLEERFPEREVELSFWLYVDHRIDNMPTPELLQWNDSNELVSSEKLDSRGVHNVDGMWVRIGKRLVPEPGIRYQLKVSGMYITVDDLLIKPAGTRVFVRHPNGERLLDNFRVPVAKDI